MAPGAATAPAELQALRYPGREPFALSQERGQVVLIDVWATWCVPCRRTLPVVQRLGKELAERGLRVYALSVDEDPRGIPAFLAELALTLPVLLDVEARAAESVLHLDRIPSTFVFDRKGRLRHAHGGMDDGFEAQVRAEVAALLAEP